MPDGKPSPNLTQNTKTSIIYANNYAKEEYVVAEHEISKAVIKRLPRYYRYLGDLIDAGTERISSNELSDMMNVTASQIRQDLNNFGGFGQQGYGYNVKYLYNEIGRILGLDRTYNVIIIGAGNLGKALANYNKFEKRGFLLKALFDRDPEKRGREIRGLKIYQLEELPDYLDSHEIDIVTITVPKAPAEQITPILVEHGVKAIWNFAHTDLKVPDDVVVENVHLSESMMQLSYDLNHRSEGK